MTSPQDPSWASITELNAASDWSADGPEVARRAAAILRDPNPLYTEAGVDRLLAVIFDAAGKRDRRIRLLMESGLTVEAAAAVHDVIAELCADMCAEESERK